MTDKELIKQEIERLSAEYPMSRGLLKYLNKFIDSLPEEPASEDLEEEIGYYTTSKLLKKRDHSTEVYHLTQRDCDGIARHFAEWQREKDIKLEKIEDLEEFAQKWAYSNYHKELDGVNCDCLYSGVKKGAEWQKQQDYKMYAHVPLKDIHDAWQELKKNKPDIENYPAVCFQKGADWRENHMKELLRTEYEKGRFDMREEMIKDAVETTIVNDWQYGKDQDHAVIPAIHQRIKGFTVGDKIKIIICKPEQQCCML